MQRPWASHGLAVPVATGRRAATMCGALVCVAALLAGCGTSPTTSYFSLPTSMPAAAPPAAYAGPPVQVLAVHLPALLDRLEVMRATGPGRFEVDEVARWAAAPGRMARQTLTEDLVNRLPAGAVVFPEAQRPDSALAVSVDVLSFHAEGGNMQADVSWNYRLGTGAAMLGTTRTARLATPAGDGSPAATAQALGALLGQVADRIAADLAALPARTPDPAR